VNELSRRSVLRAGLAVGGGLLLEFGSDTAEAATKAAQFVPSAFLRLTNDGAIHLAIARVEMGQGTTTMFAQLVAEELSVAPAALTLDLVGNDSRYANPAMGFQLTGGSNSTSGAWEPYRQAGAVAREMLISAAAGRFGAKLRADLVAKDGVVTHTPSGKSLRYGELVDDAAKLMIPKVEPKTKGFTVVGQPVPRVDSHVKVTGQAQYGIDVQLPNLKVAVLLRSPVPGGTVASFDATEAKALGGVSHVVQVPQGIAIVGDTYFHARRAAQVVKVEWNGGALKDLDSEKLEQQHLEAVRGKSGKRIKNVGDVGEVLKGPRTVIEAEYFLPYLAHAPMEPQNATAWLRDGKCEIWAPTQGPGMAEDQLARELDLPRPSITVHQTWIGGGFGRRISQDYILEAAQVSKAIGGPVKVVWSREDDMRHSPYRPAATHRVRGALDASGKPEAWHHRVATQSLLKQAIPSFVGAGLPSGLRFLQKSLTNLATGAVAESDPLTVEGIDSLPYEIPNLGVDFVPVEPGVPVTFWRSVGHSHTAFATESFIDELAHAAKQDPLEFRRTLLSKQHRHRWVLELVAEKLGWASPAPAGLGRGLAVHKCFDSYAACAVEVAVDGTTIQVKRLILAIDCGRVVNPDIVKQQLESAAVFALSATLKQRITFAEGKVQQSNFHDFAPLRMSEIPKIETYLRENEAAPTGVGEPGVPVVAPAVANAVFNLTGKRLRRLPLSLES
jgi:CO/xanthine dehydrogenase Mo-binding subunit